MAQLRILIQKSLLTARYWIPVAKGWVDADAEITLSASVATSDVRERYGLAIVDSILASTLLDDYHIVAAHGVACRRFSALNLVTAVRPDDIEAVTISTPGVSLSGRAVAEIVIPRFYGISIAGWTDEERQIDENHASITEGVAALVQQPEDQRYHEDLGRAWFLFTDCPYVSHLCIARREAVDTAPEAVGRAIDTLDLLIGASTSRARELRRNLSQDHGIDREIITELFADQVNRLQEPEIAGIATLFTRAGLLSDPGHVQRHLVKLDS